MATTFMFIGATDDNACDSYPLTVRSLRAEHTNFVFVNTLPRDRNGDNEPCSEQKTIDVLENMSNGVLEHWSMKKRDGADHWTGALRDGGAMVAYYFDVRGSEPGHRLTRRMKAHSF